MLANVGLGSQRWAHVYRRLHMPPICLHIPFGSSSAWFCTFVQVPLCCATMKGLKGPTVTLEILTAALRPIVAKFGRSLCRYPCEANKVESAKLYIDKIPQEHILLNALHEIAETLVFTRKLIKEALQIILIEQDWTMSQEEKVSPHGRNSVNLCMDFRLTCFFN